MFPFVPSYFPAGGYNFNSWTPSYVGQTVTVDPYSGMPLKVTNDIYPGGGISTPWAQGSWGWGGPFVYDQFTAQLGQSISNGLQTLGGWIGDGLKGLWNGLCWLGSSVGDFFFGGEPNLVQGVRSTQPLGRGHINDRYPLTRAPIYPPVQAAGIGAQTDNNGIVNWG